MSNGKIEQALVQISKSLKSLSTKSKQNSIYIVSLYKSMLPDGQNRFLKQCTERGITAEELSSLLDIHVEIIKDKINKAR